MIYLILSAVLSVTTFLVYRYKERCLYVLFLTAYTQNFVVAFLYTHGYMGRDVARGLLLFKDFLLLELFMWSVAVLFRRFRSPWPHPFRPLLVLTAYCGFRFLVGFVFLGDDWSLGLYRLRNIFSPLEILVVVVVLTALSPAFGRQFLRHITYVLSALAVVALAIVLWAPRDFWVANANIAELQADVKGDSDKGMYFEEGVSATGSLTGGREMLQFLSSFRAIGTFGEALALAFSMAVPVLLLSFYFPKNTIAVLSLAAATGALLFSLSRSAWIFCTFIGIYVLVRRGQYRLLLIVGCSILALLLLWPPLAEFAGNTIAHILPAADNPDSEHAEGVLWFYTHGFSDSRNILGKGMRDEAQEIPESGYAYLLEHFGLVAYVSFLWFCISLYRQLRKISLGSPGLSVVAQGIPLGVLIIMHFSQYPFSLPTFMSLWYVVGFCLSKCLLPKDKMAALSGSFAL